MENGLFWHFEKCAASIFMVTEFGSVNAEVTGRMKCTDYVGRLQQWWLIKATGMLRQILSCAYGNSISVALIYHNPCNLFTQSTHFTTQITSASTEPNSVTINMRTSSSKTSKLTYYPTWCNNPKNYHLSNTYHKNLKTIQSVVCHLDIAWTEVLFSQQLIIIHLGKMYKIHAIIDNQLQ
jgi:hypothetical protein